MNTMKFVLLVFLVFCSEQIDGSVRNKRAALTYKDGEVVLLSDKGKDVVLQPGKGGRVRINGPAFHFKFGAVKKRCNQVNKGTASFINGVLSICDGFRYVRMNAKLGSANNPAPSCKAILKDDWSATSGVYHIKTNPSITKVYCYMNSIPGCGGGGWTTIMKTNGYMPTFKYQSSLWKNKAPYHVTGGQSGVDHQETKLPTYWTLPFTKLCLGMRGSFQPNPKWIHLVYRASSLFSVIADGKYRRTSIGRSTWKSLISDSSLQRNCNREGFNAKNKAHKYSLARIGIISNQENDCRTPDSFLGFGAGGSYAAGISTGNFATNHSPDNGKKSIKAFGYILAQ